MCHIEIGAASVGPSWGCEQEIVYKIN